MYKIAIGLDPLIFFFIKTEFSTFKTSNSSSKTQFSNGLLESKVVSFIIALPDQYFHSQAQVSNSYTHLWEMCVVGYLAGNLYWHVTTTDFFFFFEIHSVQFCLED